jgi:hypothetical protein
MNGRELSRRALSFVSGRLAGCLLAGWLLAWAGPAAQAQQLVTCGDGPLPPQPSTASVPNLKVTGTCTVGLGTTYYYGAVNIVRGGTLLFRESTYRGPDGGPNNSKTHFWASSIIIENEGALVADGGPYMQGLTAFGYYGGTLTIHLWGRNDAIWDRTASRFTQENLATPCVTEQSSTVGPCGIPVFAPDGKTKFWENNGADILTLPGEDKDRNPVRDYFYQYGALYGDGRCVVAGNPNDKSANFSRGACRNPAGAEVTTAKLSGYFGNKVLAVSFGGTLDLAGWKGATYDGYWDNVPGNSGTSWMRLADGQSLEVGATSLVLERYAGWAANDEIVVTTTDYLPGHSEKLQINADYKSGDTIGFRAVESPDGKIRWRHNGTRYGGPNDRTGPAGDPTRNQWTRRLAERIRTSMDPDLVKNGAETRAAVALLTRSIRIVSGGDVAGAEFGHRQADNKDPEVVDYSYGGHMVVRQGFKKVQIKGVEFAQMGQGGRLAHYPVHFHMARKTPEGTFVKDSSINESMTRWIVIHSTQGVTLARNVGYKSIGHGFYLEDGTETDNKFHSNIGIFARAAIAYAPRSAGEKSLNPRSIPGILSENSGDPRYRFPQRSDSEFPTVFWITNGWNDFIGNMAAGAGTCGAAYWLVPAENSDMVEVSPTHRPMNWSGYSALQGRPGYGGATPLRTFSGNHAIATMHSFQTTPDAPACNGVLAAKEPDDGKLAKVRAIESDAPPPGGEGHYYPQVTGARKATYCPPGADGPDCRTVPMCADGSALGSCAVTVLDRFTSSFHWAEGDVSAIWLRPFWYLLTNSVLSDVQNGGLTFVSGGDYTRSSAIQGYWAVARNTVFIGNTNDASNPYTRNTGPFSTTGGLKCDQKSKQDTPGWCLSAAEGITMPTSGFFTNQRLLNIYDGPSYQDSNAYLDINTANCPLWPDNDAQGSCMYGTRAAYLRLKLKPGTDSSSCYLPNAGIGWKQPNGFYYPPAFHSRNLFFDNVDLRHYVIDPPFVKNTYFTDKDEVARQYCTPETTIFNTWTSIDRQTELNDNDGTLTGLTNDADPGPLQQTISVNEDAFFNAPVETAECASAVGPNATPAQACKKPDDTQPPATAKTSPYDYLTTVVYRTQASGIWDSNCSYPNCYGAPLYRQYLTPKELKEWNANGCGQIKAGGVAPEKCRWPFIRMSGLNLSQRQTMTVNNGLYYLDTTVSAATQADKSKYTTDPRPTSFNVFQAGQTYTMFFVFAKSTTVQTYQIYVGSNFKLDDFKRGRVDIRTVDLAFFTPKIKDDESWATAILDNDNILTVKVDLSKLKADLEPTPANGLCQPRSFCRPKDKPDDNICTSALPSDNPLWAESDAVCRTWAVKDLDCPSVIEESGVRTQGGCLGFSFKLPPAPDFAADDKYRRPGPQPFPVDNKDKTQGKPDWTTQFKTLASDKAGAQCTYAEAPKRDCIP